MEMPRYRRGVCRSMENVRIYIDVLFAIEQINREIEAFSGVKIPFQIGQKIGRVYRLNEELKVELKNELEKEGCKCRR